MNILFAAKQGFSYNRTLTLWNGLETLDNVNLRKFEIISKNHFDFVAFNEAADWADFIYIPPFRHSDARFLYGKTKKPIIFDPLISKYLTKAIDYKQFWKAPQKYFVDLWSLKNCDLLLADTQNHKQYYHKMFGIRLEKIFVLPIGAETNVYFPTENKASNDVFRVGFYGSFVPLQGAEKIAETAHLLRNEKDIHFHIIGNGYTYKKTLKVIQQNKLNNISLHGKVHYTQLQEFISSFDITLGIFGDSLKADLVVPNKIYHYAAIKKACITKDTPGIKEIFIDGENILLTENIPRKMAEKILYLKNNPDIRNKLAENAYQLIQNKYSHVHIAQMFVDVLQNYKPKS
jgi:glycosyltransferase involved in cell wall biosynthesis